jgi:hypothetical protein
MTWECLKLKSVSEVNCEYIESFTTVFNFHFEFEIIL